MYAIYKMIKKNSMPKMCKNFWSARACVYLECGRFSRSAFHSNSASRGLRSPPSPRASRSPSRNAMDGLTAPVRLDSGCRLGHRPQFRYPSSPSTIDIRPPVLPTARRWIRPAYRRFPVSCSTGRNVASPSHISFLRVQKRIV